LDSDKPTSVAHSNKNGVMERSVRLSTEGAPRVESNVGEIQRQTSANEIAFSQRTMNVYRIIPQALGLSPQVQTSRWMGFDSLNSICVPQSTHDFPWIAAGKAMYENP
jgi:hypothetical protein